MLTEHKAARRAKAADIAESAEPRGSIETAKATKTAKSTYSKARGLRTRKPVITATTGIRHLHRLLCAKSFSRWPLRVRFFAPDVFDIWRSWEEQSPKEQRVEAHVSVSFDEPTTRESAQDAVIGAEKEGQAREVVQFERQEEDQDRIVAKSGKQEQETSSAVAVKFAVPSAIAEIDVSYMPAKQLLEKSRGVLSSSSADESGSRSFQCAICASTIHPADDAHIAALICPSERCDALCHLSCLAAHFLAEERMTTVSRQDNGADAVLIPTSGSCPKCLKRSEWKELVTDLSLRLRGAKEVRELVRKNSGRRRGCGREQG
ncbi:hypothetical protein BDY21DRAFT_68158 [Lineolata rhizophorae]|uniref:Structure-specific endonuclease subunit SLX1 C-terminal domain-containing protein n=1 Tax=Lineolata rhizophorae TaxID=578093 RepID=A0A6A6NVS5_9PEZI|nr:hypothetical protein BDY21DRAFT_68158 [Lineolata rhizophorae]